VTTLNPAELDQLSINTIRFLSVDAVQKANSGHPGLPLAAAPLAYVLWTRFLQHNPSNPHWSNRDRFVLSAVHGSMLLSSLLGASLAARFIGAERHQRRLGKVAALEEASER
jgi:transketolase